MAPDINSVFVFVARRKYVRVGSAPASMLAKATATNTKFMSSEFIDSNEFHFNIKNSSNW